MTARSPQALKQKQTQLELPLHKLVQYCKTRWNSAADMLARLHEQRWAITAVLSDRTVTKLVNAKTLELIDDHWQTIEDLLPVLQSLKTASEALGGENYVSVSMVYPLVQSLLCRHLQTCHGESQKVTEFKSIVAASLKQRINTANLENAGKTPLLTSALDPRHKHLRFLDENMREEVRKKLLEHYQSIILDASGTDAAAVTNDEEDGMPTRRKRLSQSSRDEWEQFLLEPCIPPDEDHIQWWNENKKRFTKLSLLAHRYLCVPSTSVPQFYSGESMASLLSVLGQSSKRLPHLEDKVQLKMDQQQGASNQPTEEEEHTRKYTEPLQQMETRSRSSRSSLSKRSSTSSAAMRAKAKAVAAQAQIAYAEKEAFMMKQKAELEASLMKQKADLDASLHILQVERAAAVTSSEAAAYE
ncbi:zinc finger BED domain-containing protein 4-like [Carassius auratus]|uniref:Zinc finger BED domain-containing protein 4-like n=1 Tax=Carassius auratus TaxID=7957 RepID=A0A6P6N873_CARAU|nr:zinc finger BED domain-containing protein 4-like [Carassius auratus]